MSDLRVMLPDHNTVSCRALKHGGVTFGRDASCDVVLADPRVSSRHLSIFASDPQGSSWFVSDLNSRHGVTVNGSRVTPGAPTPVRVGDWIGAGPAMMRVVDSHGERSTGTPQATLIDGPVSRVASPSKVLLGIAELQHISRISAARSREELCVELLTCVLAISGYARGAIAQVCGSDTPTVDLVDSRTAHPGLPPVTSISRSLVLTAIRSGVAVYDDTSLSGMAAAGMSILQSSISAACCIRLSTSIADDGIALLLYLESRGHEPRARQESVEVANALASVAAACLGRLNATELEQRRAGLERELRSARELQEKLLPPATGELLSGVLRYRLLSLPGKVVAGDIVDLMQLDSQRAAVVLGDVMGKGAAAGMLMSAVQARLSQGLLDGVPLASLLERVNRDTCARFPGMMVSLWIGVIDLSTNRLTYIDAGHGMALYRPAKTGDDLQDLVSGGGLVLGGDEDSVYEMAGIDLHPGDRVLLFTDGIPEQPDLKGNEFGSGRVRSCFTSPIDGLGHLAHLHQSMTAHADGAVQRDDITGLVIEVMPDTGQSGV